MSTKLLVYPGRACRRHQRLSDPPGREGVVDATIIEQHGDLLAAVAAALVNPVNTRGVMGKGLALRFKQAYPEMFAGYRAAAAQGEVRLGRMHVRATGLAEGPRYVVGFPTKDHWRSRSRLGHIDSGLLDLVRVVEELGIGSIAVPALGCGLGGLAWSDVEPRIRAALAPVPGLTVLLFPPVPRPAEVGAQRPLVGRPGVTAGREAGGVTRGRVDRTAPVGRLWRLDRPSVPGFGGGVPARAGVRCR